MDVWVLTEGREVPIRLGQGLEEGALELGLERTLDLAGGGRAHSCPEKEQHLWAQGGMNWAERMVGGAL